MNGKLGISISTSRQNLPFSRVLNRMAEKILHQRPAAKPVPKRGPSIVARGAARKLTEQQVKEARARYANGEWPSVIAKSLGMNKYACKMMLQGISYAWVR